MFTVTASCLKIQCRCVETSGAFKVNIFCFINEHRVHALRPFFTFLMDTLLRLSGKQYIIDNSCTLKCFGLYQGHAYLQMLHVMGYVK